MLEGATVYSYETNDYALGIYEVWRTFILQYPLNVRN